MSTTIAYFYSIISMVTGQELRFFEASASVLTIFTIGEYLESRVMQSTYDSIKKLIALKPKTAMVIRSDGKRETVNVDDIVRGDIFIAKPGENIATDGIIVSGESSVDESMITGESIPIDKSVGAKVIGGTVNKSGYLEIKATNVGSQTVLANIVEMVKKARTTKPSYSKNCRYYCKIFYSINFYYRIGFFNLLDCNCTSISSLWYNCFCNGSSCFLSLCFGNSNTYGSLIRCW